MGKDQKKQGKKIMKPGGGQGLAPVGGARVLTAAEFQGLASVPPEAEWFANIDNLSRAL